MSGYSRDVLTVSTQPVDKSVSELSVQLSPSYGIQASIHPRDITNLDCEIISIVIGAIRIDVTYIGSFPCLFRNWE